MAQRGGRELPPLPPAAVAGTFGKATTVDVFCVRPIALDGLNGKAGQAGEDGCNGQDGATPPKAPLVSMKLSRDPTDHHRIVVDVDDRERQSLRLDGGPVGIRVHSEGGDAGHGGHGGAAGKRIQGATIPLRGGLGGRGGNGGEGGTLRVLIDEADLCLLVLLTEVKLKGGKAGRKGLGGPAREEDNVGDFIGKNGLDGTDGIAGKEGTKEVHVRYPDGSVKVFDDLLHLHVTSATVAPSSYHSAGPKPLITPSDTVHVTVTLHNPSPLPFPAPFTLTLRSSPLVNPTSEITVSTPILPRTTVTLHEQCLRFSVPTQPPKDGDPLSLDAKLRFIARIPGINCDVTDTNVTFVPFHVQQRLELSAISLPECVSPAGVAPVITQVVNRAAPGTVGHEKSSVLIRVAESGAQPLACLVDHTGAPQHEIRFEIAKDAIEGATALTQLCSVRFLENASPYSTAILLAQLFIDERLVQSRISKITLSDTFEGRSEADVLLVVDSRATAKGVDAWRALCARGCLQVDVFNTSLFGGLSFTQRLAALDGCSLGEYAAGLVVVLLADDAVQNVGVVAKAATRYGFHVYVPAHPAAPPLNDNWTLPDLARVADNTVKRVHPSLASFLQQLQEVGTELATTVPVEQPLTEESILNKRNSSIKNTLADSATSISSGTSTTITATITATRNSNPSLLGTSSAVVNSPTATTDLDLSMSASSTSTSAVAAARSSLSSDAVMLGYLEKRGGVQGSSGFKLRFWALFLDTLTLCYYKAPGDACPQGIVDLREAHVKLGLKDGAAESQAMETLLETGEKAVARFRVITKQRTFYLYFSEACRAAVRAITHAAHDDFIGDAFYRKVARSAEEWMVAVGGGEQAGYEVSARALLSATGVTVHTLIARGVDVNVRGRGGITALHQAARVSDAEACVALLQAGASLTAETAERLRPIDLATSTAVVNVLKGLVNTHDVLPMIKAGDIDGLRRIITPASANSMYSDHGYRLLHYAAFCESIEAMETLVKLGANVDAPNTTGWTVLLVAASKCLLKPMECLLRLGAKVTLDSDNTRVTPLHYAAFSRRDKPPVVAKQLLTVRAQMCRLLIAYGAPTAVESRALTGQAETPVSLATAPVIRSAIESAVALRLVVIAVRSGDASKVSKFVKRLSAGLDDRVLDEPQRPTVLHMAAGVGRVDMVRALVDAGADVTAVDAEGRRAEQWARDKGHADNSELLALLNQHRALSSTSSSSLSSSGAVDLQGTTLLLKSTFDKGTLRRQRQQQQQQKQRPLEDVVRMAASENVQFAGWLKKRGAVNSAYKQRWFVLRKSPPTLAYYKSPDSKEPRGVIDLVQFYVTKTGEDDGGEASLSASAATAASLSTPFSTAFNVVTPTRTFFLDAVGGRDGVELLHRWRRLLDVMSKEDDDADGSGGNGVGAVGGVVLGGDGTAGGDGGALSRVVAEEGVLVERRTTMNTTFYFDEIDVAEQAQQSVAGDLLRIVAERAANGLRRNAPAQRFTVVYECSADSKGSTSGGVDKQSHTVSLGKLRVYAATPNRNATVTYRCGDRECVYAQDEVCGEESTLAFLCALPFPTKMLLLARLPATFASNADTRMYAECLSRAILAGLCDELACFWQVEWSVERLVNPRQGFALLHAFSTLKTVERGTDKRLLVEEIAVTMMALNRRLAMQQKQVAGLGPPQRRSGSQSAAMLQLFESFVRQLTFGEADTDSARRETVRNVFADLTARATARAADTQQTGTIDEQLWRLRKPFGSGGSSALTRNAGSLFFPNTVCSAAEARVVPAEPTILVEGRYVYRTNLDRVRELNALGQTTHFRYKAKAKE